MDFSNQQDLLGFGKQKKSKRRSSILKITRPALGDLDPNRDPDDLTIGIGRRKSRRVSFAETYQVKEFVKDSGSLNVVDPLEFNAGDHGSTIQATASCITGFESLLTGEIQSEPQKVVFQDTIVSADCSLSVGANVVCEEKSVKKTTQLYIPQKQFDADACSNVTKGSDFGTWLNTNVNKYVGSGSPTSAFTHPQDTNTGSAYTKEHVDSENTQEHTVRFGDIDNDIEETMCLNNTLRGERSRIHASSDGDCDMELTECIIQAELGEDDVFDKDVHGKSFISRLSDSVKDGGSKTGKYDASGFLGSLKADNESDKENQAVYKNVDSSAFLQSLGQSEEQVDSSNFLRSLGMPEKENAFDENEIDSSKFLRSLGIPGKKRVSDDDKIDSSNFLQSLGMPEKESNDTRIDSSNFLRSLGMPEKDKESDDNKIDSSNLLMSLGMSKLEDKTEVNKKDSSNFMQSLGFSKSKDTFTDDKIDSSNFLLSLGRNKENTLTEDKIDSTNFLHSLGQSKDVNETDKVEGKSFLESLGTYGSADKSIVQNLPTCVPQFNTSLSNIKLDPFKNSPVKGGVTAFMETLGLSPVSQVKRFNGAPNSQNSDKITYFSKEETDCGMEFTKCLPQLQNETRIPETDDDKTQYFTQGPMSDDGMEMTKCIAKTLIEKSEPNDVLNQSGNGMELTETLDIANNDLLSGRHRLPNDVENSEPSDKICGKSFLSGLVSDTTKTSSTDSKSVLSLVQIASSENEEKYNASGFLASLKVSSKQTDVFPVESKCTDSDNSNSVVVSDNKYSASSFLKSLGRKDNTRKSQTADSDNVENVSGLSGEPKLHDGKSFLENLRSKIQIHKSALPDDSNQSSIVDYQSDKTTVFSKEETLAGMEFTECIPAANRIPENMRANKTVCFGSEQTANGMEFTTCVSALTSESGTESENIATPGVDDDKTQYFVSGRAQDGMEMTECLSSNNVNSYNKSVVFGDKTKIFNQDKTVCGMEMTDCLPTSNKMDNTKIFNQDKTVCGMEMTECLPASDKMDNTKIFNQDKTVCGMEMTECLPASDKIDNTITNNITPDSQSVASSENNKTKYFNQNVTNYGMELTECLAGSNVNKLTQNKVAPSAENEETKYFGSGEMTCGMELTECIPLSSSTKRLDVENPSVFTAINNSKSQDRTLTGMDFIKRVSKADTSGNAKCNSSVMTQALPSPSTETNITKYFRQDQTSHGMELTECVNSSDLYAANKSRLIESEESSNSNKTKYFNQNQTALGMELTECLPSGNASEVDRLHASGPVSVNINLKDANSTKVYSPSQTMHGMELTECLPVGSVSQDSRLNVSEAVNTNTTLKAVNSTKLYSPSQTMHGMELTECLASNKTSQDSTLNATGSVSANITLKDTNKTRIYSPSQTMHGMELTGCVPSVSVTHEADLTDSNKTKYFNQNQTALGMEFTECVRPINVSQDMEPLCNVSATLKSANSTKTYSPSQTMHGMELTECVPAMGSSISNESTLSNEKVSSSEKTQYFTNDDTTRGMELTKCLTTSDNTDKTKYFDHEKTCAGMEMTECVESDAERLQTAVADLPANILNKDTINSDANQLCSSAAKSGTEIYVGSVTSESPQKLMVENSSLIEGSKKRPLSSLSNDKDDLSSKRLRHSSAVSCAESVELLDMQTIDLVDISLESNNSKVASEASISSSDHDSSNKTTASDQSSETHRTSSTSSDSDQLFLNKTTGQITTSPNKSSLNKTTGCLGKLPKSRRRWNSTIGGAADRSSHSRNGVMDKSSASCRSAGEISILAPKCTLGQSMSQSVSTTIIDDVCPEIDLGNPIDEYLSHFRIHFGKNFNTRRSTNLPLSKAKVPESMSDYLKCCIPLAEIKLYQWANGELENLQRKYTVMNAEIEERLTKNIPHLLKDYDNEESCKKMNFLMSMSRKSAKKWMKDWRIKMVKTLRHAAEDEEENLNDCVADLEKHSTNVESVSTGLEEAHSKLDEMIARLENEQTIKRTIHATYEETKKAIEETTSKLTRVKDEKCALEDENSNLKNEICRLQEETAKLQREKVEKPSISLEDAEQRLVRMNSYFDLDIERLDTEGAVFLFHHGTLAVNLTFGCCQNTTSGFMPHKQDRTIKDVQIVSMLADDCSQSGRLAHDIILSQLDAKSLNNQHSTTATLQQLVHTINGVVCRANRQFEDLEDQSVWHHIYIDREHASIEVEFSHMKNRIKFSIILYVDTKKFPTANMTWDFLPCIGNVRRSDLEPVIDTLHSGTSQFRKVINAVDSFVAQYKNT